VSVSWRVESTRRIAYEVAIVGDLLDPATPDLAAAWLDGPPGRRLVVADRAVWELYGERLRAYVRAHGAACEVIALDPGEGAKRIDQVLAVVAACDSAGVLRRQTPILVFGGGVALDVAGLAASLYRRGVPWVRVPTTLVAMIDAGVGVKTGVNHLGRKSLIGSYHPPAAVLVDPGFMATLDRVEISAGLAEAIKIALVRDAGLFELIAGSVAAIAGPGRSPVDRELVSRSIAAMLDELSDNLWEERLERLADFGHTFSPGIEMAALPRLSHGAAVALDIALSCALASGRGLLADRDGERIRRVLRGAGLPVCDEVISVELLVAALEAAARHRDGLQRVPLLTGIGSAVFVNDVSEGELETALALLRKEAEG
jgi:3-dehydroquinate synthetase